MRTLNKLLILCVLILISCNVLLGCSGSEKNPVAPGDVSNAPASEKAADSNRMLWGLWQIHFNPSDLSIAVTPVRDIQAHYNITTTLIPPYCDDCLIITVNSFDPVTRIGDADVTLRNPYGITGLDIRGILFTNDYGLELLNPDDWTGLWDFPGGKTINPFKAFAKDQPNRAFSPGAQHTEKYRVYIPLTEPVEDVHFGVDGSYPANCDEPYEITNFWQEPIVNMKGSSGNIYVDVLDWQGDVNKVTLVAPEITSEQFSPFTHWGGNTWSMKLVNNTGVATGTYVCRVIATSTGSGGVALYDYVSINITEVQFNPVDVTPPWLHFSAIDICIDGNFAYAASNYWDALHIFNISDPNNPIWVNKVQIPGDAKEVAVSDGYAYIAADNKGLSIIDVSPPESAHLVKTLGAPFHAYGITVAGEYAYVVGWKGCLFIIDISPPELAYVVKTVKTPGVSPNGVTVAGGYAYVADDDAGLEIIDISSPESAYIVKTVQTSGYAYKVDISGTYAYVAEQDYGLEIIDVSFPESAHIVKTVDTPGKARGVAVSGGYAYVADEAEGLQIFDISIPESAYILKAIATQRWAIAVYIANDYAYVADGCIEIIDISSPESAYTIKTIEALTYIWNVASSNKYVYALGLLQDIYTIDISPPEYAHIVNFTPLPYPMHLSVSGGYAYATGEDAGLVIIDISSPESPYIVKTVNTAKTNREVAVSEGYAYLTDSKKGLLIVDISPPESAFLVNTVDTPGHADGVAVSGGYGYVADHDEGLEIIDVSPPESAHIIKTVSTPGYADRVAVSDGYAYVPFNNDGLLVIDVSSPELAYVLKTIVIEPSYPSYDIVVLAGYIYVASPPKLQIIDISPIEDAHVVNTISLPGSGWGCGINVRDNYAYVADTDGGLRIIELW